MQASTIHHIQPYFCLDNGEYLKVKGQRNITFQQTRKSRSAETFKDPADLLGKMPGNNIRMVFYYGPAKRG